MHLLRSWLQVHRWRVLAASVSFLVIYLLATDFAPRVAAAYTLFSVWQQQQSRITSVEKAAMEQAQLDVRKRQLQQRFADLYVNLPRSDQISILLRVLQESAAAAQVVLQEIRPAERAVFVGYDELPFQLVLRGAFHEIGRFIGRIEQSPYIIKVKHLHLQRTKAPSAMLRAEVLLSVIVLKEQEEAR